MNAFKDFLNNYSLYKDKVKVINFVSQTEIYDKNNNFDINIYSSDPFFYLPNQFWYHKNHIVVFEAIKIY